MKLHILGTAAAEGWPAIFCRCDGCTKARAAGGKNIRTRAGALINDHIKLDWGPDTYMQGLRDGLDLGAIDHLIVTHTHHDHLFAADIEMRQPPYAWDPAGTLHIHAHDKALDRISAAIHHSSNEALEYHLVQPFVRFSIDDLQVTPLLADHDRRETCLLYLFEQGNRRLLWGHDSGYFPDATWEWLSQEAPMRGPLTTAILDCTNGPLDGMRNHMGIEGVRKVKADLIAKRIADESTAFVATHFSHNGKLLHAELEQAFVHDGVLVAYDGMELKA